MTKTATKPKPRGKRAIKPATPAPKPTAKSPAPKAPAPVKWKTGERVTAYIGEGKQELGTIVGVSPKFCRVKFDSGKTDNVTHDRVALAPEGDDLPEVKRDLNSAGGVKGNGFVHWPIHWYDFHNERIKPNESGQIAKDEWKDAHVAKFKADGVEFRAEWRKTRLHNDNNQGVDGYCIDLYVKDDPKAQGWLARSISYFYDPRLGQGGLPSLNADICSAALLWMGRTLNGGRKTFEDLAMRANHPTIHINRAETIGRIIMKLTEFYKTAITAGGQRTLEFHGDREGEVGLRISVDLTAQAIALDGKKAPSIAMGSILDVVKGAGQGTGATAVVKDAEGKARGRAIVNTPSSGNVDSIVKMLEAAKASGDKAQQRKLRAALRKMGHRGGARAANKSDAQRATKVGNAS